MRGQLGRAPSRQSEDPRRVWVSWYNRGGQRFTWVRVSFRLRGWHRLGGVWWQRHPSRFKLLLPQGPRGVRSVKARQVVDHWRKAQRPNEVGL